MHRYYFKLMNNLILLSYNMYHSISLIKQLLEGMHVPLLCDPSKNWLSKVLLSQERGK